jgi:tRNA uridine 5-carboxymethylaminomethyl modification enzyme
MGSVDDERWSRFEARRCRLEENQARLSRTTVSIDGSRLPADRALRQPGVDVRDLLRQGQLALALVDPLIDLTSLETIYRYEGYMQREKESIARLRRQESRAIPEQFRFDGIPGLSRESVERLTAVRPETLGQAARIPGLTPAAIAVIAAHLRRATAVGPSRD